MKESYCMEHFIVKHVFVKLRSLDYNDSLSLWNIWMISMSILLLGLVVGQQNEIEEREKKDLF